MPSTNTSSRNPEDLAKASTNIESRQDQTFQGTMHSFSRSSTSSSTDAELTPADSVSMRSVQRPRSYQDQSSTPASKAPAKPRIYSGTSSDCGRRINEWLFNNVKIKDTVRGLFDKRSGK